MKFYMSNKPIYVKTNDGMIYSVDSGELFADDGYIKYTLKLEAGYDYIDIDGNDDQGYVGTERFNEVAQSETLIQLFVKEGLEECLDSDGYELLDKLPTIHR